MAASSATKYLNTYETDIMLMFASSSQNLQVHSFCSCKIAESVMVDFSSTGEIKLPHFVHTLHCKIIILHESDVSIW